MPRAERWALSVGLVLLMVGCATSGVGPADRVTAGVGPANPGVENAVAVVEKAPQGEASVRYRVSDAHFHYVDFLQETDGIERLLEAMDAAGVEHAMITGMPLVKKWHAADPRRPLYYLEDDSRTYWYSATDVLVARALAKLTEDQRQRFHPFISGFNPTDRNAVDHVERMLEWYPDLWEGIGEVMARHDDLTALTYGEAARADHVALDAVYELAAERDLPVSVHSNVGSVWLREPIYLHEMENALKRHPETRFIWSHAGISRRINIPTLTAELRRLLSTYENLWIDLSWVVFDDHVAPDRVPEKDWVALAEDFPARFMIGSDSLGHMDEHVATVQRYYTFLDALSEDTARRVARDNFLSILPERVRLRLASASQAPR
jgi:predicted TIM-barrel fold metal-dependent hydrolase